MGTYLNPGHYKFLEAVNSEIYIDKSEMIDYTSTKSEEWEDTFQTFRKSKLYHYKGNILLVSVNYNKEVPSTDVKYKHHSCRIEKL